MNLIAIVLLTLITGIGSVWLAAVLRRVAARYTSHLLSLAAGALLSTALMHLLPEAFESHLDPRVLFGALLVGVVFFFLLDKAELWHHGHEHHHPVMSGWVDAHGTHAPLPAAFPPRHSPDHSHGHAHECVNHHVNEHAHIDAHGHSHHHAQADGTAHGPSPVRVAKHTVGSAVSTPPPTADHGGVKRKPGAWSVLLGDSVHCFGDGILIASAYLATPWLGLMAALAVLAHEVPHHMGDLIVLQNSSGQNSRAALVKVSLAGAVTVVGGVVGYLLVGLLHHYLAFFLVAAASSFIYVALADLIPQLQHHVSVRSTLAQVAWLLAGMALVALTTGLSHSGASHVH